MTGGAGMSPIGTSEPHGEINEAEIMRILSVSTGLYQRGLVRIYPSTTEAMRIRAEWSWMQKREIL